MIDDKNYMTMKEFMHILTYVSCMTWQNEGKAHPSDLWANVSVAGDAVSATFEYMISKSPR